MKILKRKQDMKIKFRLRKPRNAVYGSNTGFRDEDLILVGICRN